MNKHRDNHVTAELIILSRFLQVEAFNICHERVEKYQINCE